jgi:hypothetical protein
MKKTFNPSYLQFKHDMVECALEYLGNSWWESLKTSKINNIIYAKALIHCSVLSALGPLYTRDWEPMAISLQALSLMKKRLRSKFTSHYTWGTNGVCNKMDVKVYMDSYMASNGLCFMVTWTLFKNHFLEVGLTQNHETMALWMYTTMDLFYFIMCENMHE